MILFVLKINMADLNPIRSSPEVNMSTVVGKRSALWPCLGLRDFYEINF